MASQFLYCTTALDPYSGWTGEVNLYGAPNGTCCVGAITDTGPGTGFTLALYPGTFGFSIPTAATITGIELQLTAKAAYNTSTKHADLTYPFYVGNISVAPLKGQHIGGGARLTTDLALYTIGGPGELWESGQGSLTVADFNASDFITAFNIGVTSDVNLSLVTVSIDAIGIKVYYTTVTGIASVAGVACALTLGTLARSGNATFGLTGLGTTAAYAGSAPAGTGAVSLTGRSAATSPGTTFAAAPGAGMFLWNWTYGVDTYWHEVLGSLIPETGAFISGVSATGSVGTIVSTTNAQVALSGVEATSAIGTHIGYSYAAVAITGLHVHASASNVSASARGDAIIILTGRYGTASIGSLTAVGTSVGFVKGVWLLYPVTIFVEQQWQCEVEVSEVANV